MDRMKQLEIYRDLIVKAPIVIRADGNNFHKLVLKCGFNKPFDRRFHIAMVETGKEVMKKTGYMISLTYVFSDELNYLFLKDSHLPYNGRVEKILTIIASYTSSIFQKNLNKIEKYLDPIAFDARIVKLP